MSPNTTVDAQLCIRCSGSAMPTTKQRASSGASCVTAGLNWMVTLLGARTQTCGVRWRSTSGMASLSQVLGLEYPSGQEWIGGC